MQRNALEWMGTILSWPLGLITAAVSFIRRARIFHPRGLVFSAQVEALREEELKLHPHALLRFSSGWWKNREWPDVLGVAIRFSLNPRFHAQPRESDQDLLLATFDSPLKLFMGPFITKKHDYLANQYHSVLPFSTFNWKKVLFKLVPDIDSPKAPNRISRIRKAVAAHDASFTLMACPQEGECLPVARITLINELDLDQEALRFDPFRAGLGLVPEGFLQHLRIGTYRLSQWARPVEVSGQNLRRVQFKSERVVDQRHG